MTAVVRADGRTARARGAPFELTGTVTISASPAAEIAPKLVSYRTGVPAYGWGSSARRVSPERREADIAIRLTPEAGDLTTTLIGHLSFHLYVNPDWLAAAFPEATTLRSR